MTTRKQLLERLQALGDVADRPLLGGWGLYLGDDLFGLFQGGRFYLRATGDIREYDRMGSVPFSPTGPYSALRLLPPGILEDDERLLYWARRATRLSRP